MGNCVSKKEYSVQSGSILAQNQGPTQPSRAKQSILQCLKTGSRFKPHHFKWIIIKNRHYNHMRKFKGYSTFQDIPQVDNDAENVRNSIIEMGGKENDIELIEEADFNKFKQLFKKLRDQITVNWVQSQEYTFVLVYYAGHGVMPGKMTEALCNGSWDNGKKGALSKTRYPLEQ